MKRLKSATGEFIGGEPKDKGDADRSVRSAVLVHSGPNGEAVVFNSEDGDISFDKERIRRIVENHNKKIMTLAQEYGGIEKMPVGAYPAVLDMHKDDSGDRVGGRLASLLRYEDRDVPGVGKNVACAVADLTFLGKETVARVNDGRIYHLSIGIDESTDTLGEISTVIEPAAPGAMLLSQGKSNKQGVKKMPTPQKEAGVKRLAKFAEAKEAITRLTESIKTTRASLAATNELVRLGAREAEVKGKFFRLMKGAKLTPSEFKKMDFKKLAKLDDEALNTVVSTFDSQERKVLVGQLGSTAAEDFSTIGKELEGSQRKRLKSEIRGDFKRLGKKLGDDPDDDKDHGDKHEMKHKLSGPHEEIVAPGKDEHAVPGQAGDEQQLKAHLAALKHHLDKGDIEGAKQVHEKLAAHCGAYAAKPEDEKHLAEGMGVGDVKSEDYKKHMDHVQGQIDELSTNLGRIAGLVDELMKAEKAEGHEDLPGEAVSPSEQEAGKKA